jgi:hypothetical protein
VSYARFGADGSDVYVFTSSVGLECCGCILQAREDVFDSNEGMIAHLLTHIAAGHCVPDYALARLHDPEDAAVNQRIWKERAEA